MTVTSLTVTVPVNVSVTLIVSVFDCRYVCYCQLSVSVHLLFG